MIPRLTVLAQTQTRVSATVAQALTGPHLRRGFCRSSTGRRSPRYNTRAKQIRRGSRVPRRRSDNTRALIPGPRQNVVHRSCPPSIVVLRRYRGRVLPLERTPIVLYSSRERRFEKTRTFSTFLTARSQEDLDEEDLD